LHTEWGYYICLAAMLVIALFMLAYFRRKKWI
jgi:Mg2+ and Co2+ transporter CorA